MSRTDSHTSNPGVSKHREFPIWSQQDRRELARSPSRVTCFAGRNRTGKFVEQGEEEEESGQRYR